MVCCLRFPDCAAVGTIKISIKLRILELLIGIFGLICIGTAIAFVYFLYGVFAKDAPWSYVLWSFGAGVIAVLIFAALNASWQRVDYVDQLIERGYSRGEAEEAWHTADNGGMNLLRNLQQSELSEQIDRLETAINTSNGKEVAHERYSQVAGRKPVETTSHFD
jgi:hypothetical protein